MTNNSLTKGQKNKIAVSYMRTNPIRPGTPDRAITSRYDLSVQEKASDLSAKIEAKFSDHIKLTNPLERPGLQELLQYLSEHKVDYVIVPNISMLSRKGPEFLNLVDKIEQYGAKLASLEGEETGSDMYR
jgi:DNA invertase Pin-like site-specific DNA recombinase